MATLTFTLNTHTHLHTWSFWGYPC